MPLDDDKGFLNRADEFMQVFKKGAEFTQELLRENERLRFRILEMENVNNAVPANINNQGENLRLLQRIAELESEKADIVERIRQVEEENKDFANRYVEIESENNNLANLYIASYQLHSTLDFPEVLQIIIEIVINLIGAENFAIMLLDEKTRMLEAVASEGIDREMVPKVSMGGGVIGEVAKTGENYFVPDLDSYEMDMNSPMVCIPLKIKEQCIGVLVIYKLLMQKKSFADVDFELFTLLAGHAATAIFSSRLYSDSERKLNTIQGFLDLLTK
ncbi:GAF domain protein [Geobacter sp. OR-1]|uniref:GAF domain-containing protein n=1 Tax=Geobacter sp. OR-1 TaxID=1266765 RepID=UPI000541E188|nr:GAF domain-containing protein [Geobacter sp. OR-1]GAM08183.1 GAF domain protein [Geobacter sp. OR-1]